MRHMIFGESHGPAIGVVVEGVPAGLELEAVQRELNRRRPGQGPTATARKESDRLATVTEVLNALGAAVEEHPDYLVIRDETSSPAASPSPATMTTALP